MGRNLCGESVMPYGHLSWILPTVTFIATCFFLFPAFRCSLTVSKSPAGDIEQWIGYWKLEDTELATALGPEDDSNVCIKWGKGSDRDVFDGIWKFGKSIGVIGCFTTIPSAVLNVYLFFGRLSIEFFYPLIGVHLLNSFFTFMLLIILRSELCAEDQKNCVLARAGYVAIIGGILWLSASVLLFFVRRREYELIDRPYGVGFKEEKRLALPAPDDDVESTKEEPRLALPAPEVEEEKTRKKKKKKPSREVPLALPPSDSNLPPTPNSAKPKKKKSSKSKPKSKSSKSPKKSPRSSSKKRSGAPKAHEIPEI